MTKSNEKGSPVGLWEVYRTDGGGETSTVGIYEGHLLEIIFRLSKYGNPAMKIKPFIPKTIPKDLDLHSPVVLSCQEFVDIWGDGENGSVRCLPQFLKRENPDIEFEIVGEETGWGHFKIIFPGIEDINEKIRELESQIKNLKNKLR